MSINPQTPYIVEIVPSGVGGAVKNGINVSLKHAHMAEIWCFNNKGADATQCTWTLQQSSGNAGSAAGTGEKALTADVPIRYSDGFQADNALTAATAAKAYQQAVTQSVTQVAVFTVVPELCMDINNASTPFDCITVNASDPGAANSVHAFAVIWPRFDPVSNPLAD
jgi:hypothetical protein